MMRSELAMEIPEINDIVTTFVSEIENYANAGSIKIGRFRMEYRDYTTGNDVGFWRHRVKFIRRTWWHRDVVVWWRSAECEPRIKINVRLLKRYHQEIKEAIESIASKYRADVNTKKAAEDKDLIHQRDEIKKDWNSI